MHERLYRIYFQIAAIRPLGKLDWAIRRQLGRWFNNATTAPDIAMIHSLAKYRAEKCARLDHPSPEHESPLPRISVACLLQDPLSLGTEFLQALRIQDYPSENVSLLIALPSAQPEADRDSLSLPSIAKRVPVPRNEFRSAYGQLLSESETDLVLFVTDFRIPATGCLRRAVVSMISAGETVAVVDMAPTLTERAAYCDPVALDVPNSTFSFTLARKSAIERVGGFDECFPVSGQGLELSYRLRSHGLRLLCHGRSTDFSERSFVTRLGRNLPDPETLLLLRRKYGEPLLRKCGTSLYRLDCGPKARTELIERVEQTRAQSAERNAVSPSRLWSGELEIGTGRCVLQQIESPASGPLVSIIIRTHEGRGHWLRQSLCSALNQTYPSLEVVVIEDGSAEFESLVRKSNCTSNPGHTIRYVSQIKLGKSAAGNLGLETCTGKLIGFLDDDDLLLPGHVELLYNTLRSEPGAVAAYALAWEAHTPINGEPESEGVYFEVPKRMRTAFDREKLKRFNYLPIQAVLFHRSCYERAGGFDPERHYLEDWALWDKYADLGEFAYLPVITSIYRTPADPYQRIDRVRKWQRRHLDRTHDSGNAN